MRGELIGVWKETWREIWQPLIDQEGVPEDIFCELYRELSDALMDKPSIEILADIVDSPAQSRAAFEAVLPESLSGERALVVFLRSVTRSSMMWLGEVYRHFILTFFLFFLTSTVFAMICVCHANFVQHCQACSRVLFVIFGPWLTKTIISALF